MANFPASDPASEPFWKGIRNGKLLIQHCAFCGKAIHYPRAFCPTCMSADLNWSEATGQGTIHAFTIVYRHWDKSFETPFIVALVELEEGVVVTATIAGVEPEPSSVTIGLPVELVPGEVGGSPSLPSFRPRGSKNARRP